ncbi:hypothetical protein [Bacillus coahuilensis]|uniref:hypothetical protein n=1 Tax=Bacillus coahuilensis TaxID=408580 RepID=UPI000494D19D|nr:hypothetical protein [Bacillus coahuilensis]
MQYGLHGTQSLDTKTGLVVHGRHFEEKMDLKIDLLNQIYEKALEEEMLENKTIPSNEDCKVDHFSYYHVTIVADNCF